MTARAAPAPKQRWPLHRRLILWSVLGALLYFGGEALEPLLEEGTHVLLEAMEMVIEEFYEHVLHLPRRQAEIFTVWSGTILGLVVLYFIARTIVRRVMRAYYATRAWILATIAALKQWRSTWSEADITILAVAGTVLAIMLLSLLM